MSRVADCGFSAFDKPRADWQPSLGFRGGLFARGSSLHDVSLLATIPANRVISRLSESVAIARRLAEDRNRAVDVRTRAIIVAANCSPSEIEQLIRELVQTSQPQPVQSAAVRVATQANSAAAWQDLFHRWSGHTTTTRAVMLVQAVRSPAGTEALVAALEADVLSAQEIPASTREVLGQLQDETLSRRVGPVLAAVAPAVAKVLAQYADVSTRRGNAARGAIVFKQNCQPCHAIHGIGEKLGPDLTSVASRRTDLLITDILDPSPPGFG